jgi:hypothetical protein
MANDFETNDKTKGLVFCAKEDVDLELRNSPADPEVVPTFHFYKNGVFQRDMILTGVNVEDIVTVGEFVGYPLLVVVIVFDVVLLGVLVGVFDAVPVLVCVIVTVIEGVKVDVGDIVCDGVLVLVIVPVDVPVFELVIV